MLQPLGALAKMMNEPVNPTQNHQHGGKCRLTKQRIVHELTELLIVFLFISPFVVLLASYRLYLEKSDSALFDYAAAFVNAFVLAKIVITGDLIGLGRTHENKPLIVPTFHKAVVFSALYVAFLALETAAHGLLRGKDFRTALAAVLSQTSELLMRGLVTLFGAIPFFALRELRRVLGADRFLKYFLGTGMSKYWEKKTLVGKELRDAH